MKSNWKINKKIIVCCIASLFILSVVLQTPSAMALNPTFVGFNGNQPVNYIAYLVENKQNTATSANLPVTLTLNAKIYANYFAEDLTNANWQDGQGNILNSYIEGPHTNTTDSVRYWVNLGNLTINANSAVYIYQVLYNTPVNVYDGINTGAYPLWNSTYGIYDNGPNVFTAYWNFNGTNLPAGFYIRQSAPGGSVVVNNGATVTGGTGNNLNNWESIYSQASYDTQVYTMDSFVKYNGLHGSNGNTRLAGYTSYTGYYSLSDYQSSTSFCLENWNNSRISSTLVSGGVINQFQIMSVYATSSASHLSLSYGTPVDLAGSFTTDYKALGFACTDTGNAMTVSYARARISPPNNVMPTVSLYGLSELYGAIYQSGYNNGYNAGWSDGNSTGFTIGWNAALDAVGSLVDSIRINQGSSGSFAGLFNGYQALNPIVNSDISNNHESATTTVLAVLGVVAVGVVSLCVIRTHKNARR